MSYSIKPDKNRLKIFHESRKRRKFVGELIYNKKNDQYELIYDKNYAYSKNAIPLSPELDLFNLHHISEKGKLFSSFSDRIPDKSNPAFEDYCDATGISPDENNPIILLGFIGTRGPSSFIFEPVYEDTFNINEIKILRKKLHVSQYHFALALGISKVTLQKIEAGLSHDPNTLRYLQILFKFPQVALWQIKQTKNNVPQDIALKLINYFKSKE
ncbi:MAG: helix-turn-helix domain-containing protein [Gammaproteobacteria bacterium]